MIYQSNNSARWLTDEKIYCDVCKKQARIVLQTNGCIRNIGFTDCRCYHKNLAFCFGENEFIFIRTIEDINFSKRKESFIAQRKKLTPRMRYEILKRDGFKCLYCGKTSLETKLHVDHKIPVSKGGLTICENLISSCSECNLGKGNSL